MVYKFHCVGSCAVLHVPVTPFGTEYRIFTVVAADSFEEIQGIHHKERLKVRKGIYNVKGSIKLQRIGLEVVSIIFPYLCQGRS